MEKNCYLCFMPCTDYELIEDESGHSTEIYDVTLKYFDPMILSEGHSMISLLSKVICCGCWTSIHNFYKFQQRVFKSRAFLFNKNNLKIGRYFIHSFADLQAGGKHLINDKGIDDMEAIITVSDQEDEIPLSLLQDVRLKTSASGTKVGIRREQNSDQADKSDVGTLLGISNKNQLLDSCLTFENVNNMNLTAVKTETLGNTCKLSLKPLKIESISVKEDTTDDRCKRSEVVITDVESKNRGTIINICEKQKKTLFSSSKLRSLRGTVRKKEKNEQKCKMKKLSNGKLKERSKDNDMFLAKWKPILDCDLCSITVSNFDEMREHFRVEHKTKCYIKCCERKFFRRYVLTEHVRLHVNPESHKCDICGKRSTNKYNLKLHKKVVHSESKQFECEICKKKFNQKPTLDRHLLTHLKGDKKFFCKECARGYMTEEQLKYHQQTAHNFNHVCDKCGRTIHSAAALKNHLMEHAGIEKQKYPCDICAVELVTNYGLRRHKAAYHHDGSTAYVCGVCGKVASSHNALMSHKKNVHENDRKYQCTYCDKAFKRAKVLREHIAIHTGVDLYKCPHCPQTFKVSANMHHHRKRTHPVEWEIGRNTRTVLPKVDIQHVTNQVVL